METSTKVGGLTLLAVLGIGLKLAGGFARASHRTSSASAQSVNEAKQREAIVRELAEWDSLGTVRNAKKVHEASVDRSCATSQRSRYLEPQGAALAPLFRTTRRLGAPGDVTLPAASMVMGLPVMVLAMDAEGTRWCVDAVPGMVKDLATAEPRWPSSAIEKVAPGAWVIHTTPGVGVPASSTLVSASFLRELGPASLVAMAPTDSAVAFADASKPEAIRAAAKRLLPLIDTSGEEGVLQAQPLVLKNGVWSAWAPAVLPAEVAEVKKAGELAETRMVLELLDGIPRDADEREAWGALSAGEPPLDFRGGVTTEIREEKLRTTVVVEPARAEALLVGQADSVELRGETTQTLSWQAFTKKYASQLEPVKVDGATVPRVLRFVPGP